MNVREAISEASQQFGICLKEKQFDAIYEFCSGSDVFVSLPIGFGKSSATNLAADFAEAGDERNVIILHDKCFWE